MKDIKEIARQAFEPDEYIDSFSREDLIKEIRRLEDECERLRGERDKYNILYASTNTLMAVLGRDGEISPHQADDVMNALYDIDKPQETDSQSEPIKCNGLNCLSELTIQFSRTIEDYGWMTDPDDSQIYYCSFCKEGIARIKGVDGV